MRVIPIAALVAGLLLLANPALAQTPDLTGSYFGKMKCKGLDAAGEKEAGKLFVLMLVSQPTTGATSADLQVMTELIDPDTFAVLGGFFSFGSITFDVDRPDRKGLGMLNECTHLVTPQSTYQMMNFRYNVTPGELKGAVKFISLHDMTGVDGSMGMCKGGLKRIDLTDVGVPLCP